MRASSWASTTTRRARSVNRSNMPIAPQRGTGDTRLVKQGDAPIRAGCSTLGVTCSNWSSSLRVPGPTHPSSAHSEMASKRAGAREARACTVGERRLSEPTAELAKPCQASRNPVTVPGAPGTVTGFRDGRRATSSTSGWGHRALVGGFERLADVGRDTAAVRDLVAVGAGPVTDLTGAGADLRTPLGGRTTPRRSASRGDVLGHGFAEGLGILGIEVDL